MDGFVLQLADVSARRSDQPRAPFDARPLVPTCLDRWAGDTEVTGQLHPTRLPTPGNVSIDSAMGGIPRTRRITIMWVAAAPE
jgi:hypothetical protein